MMTTLKVHFDGRVLVPEQPVDLPIGKSLEVKIGNIAVPITASTENKTVAQLLAVVKAPPHVTAEDAAELDRSIAEIRTSVRPSGVFDDSGIE